MKDKVSRKITRFSMIFLLVNLATLLGTSIFFRAVSQSEIFVSKGSYYSSKYLSAAEKLSIGREWSVYDIHTGKYLGKAKVKSVTSSKDRAKSCVSQPDKSYFDLDNISLPKKSSGTAIFIRSSMNLNNDYKVKNVHFYQLPELFQQQHSKRSNGPYYLTIDLNLDGEIDIISDNSSGFAGSLYTIYGSRWIEKYNFEVLCG